MFQNDEDLLREFGQFLPDAGGAVGATIPSATSLSLVSFSSKYICIQHSAQTTYKVMLQLFCLQFLFQESFSVKTVVANAYN